MQAHHETSTFQNSQSYSGWDDFGIYFGKVIRAYPELANLFLARFGPPLVSDIAHVSAYMKALGPDQFGRYKFFEPVAIPDGGIWREEYACGHVEGFPYYMRPLSFHLPPNLRPEIMAQMPRDYEDADDLTKKILAAAQNRTLRVDI